MTPIESGAKLISRKTRGSLGGKDEESVNNDEVNDTEWKRRHDSPFLHSLNEWRMKLR